MLRCRRCHSLVNRNEFLLGHRICRSCREQDNEHRKHLRDFSQLKPLKVIVRCELDGLIVPPEQGRFFIPQEERHPRCSDCHILIGPKHEERTVNAEGLCGDCEEKYAGLRELVEARR